MGRLRTICVLTALCLCMCFTCASGAPGLSAALSGEDWTWTPGGTSVFSGEVSCPPESAGEDLTLVLSVTGSPAASDMGKIVFTAAGGKKLTLRKQKDTYSWTASDEGLQFTGNWFLPDNSRFSSATVKLSVLDSRGAVLMEEELVMRADSPGAGTAADGSVLILPDISRYVLYVAAAAGGIWILALLRVMLIRRRTRQR
ncbi:MAG: hypothetical protein K6E17_04735 [Clostridiales bacterium]|nr:hypothetical protein [Clostridiales bacterium]